MATGSHALLRSSFVADHYHITGHSIGTRRGQIYLQPLPILHRQRGGQRRNRRYNPDGSHPSGLETPDANGTEGPGVQYLPIGRIVGCPVLMNAIRGGAHNGSVCVASIVCIYFMTLLSRSLDITWIMGDVFIWSSVEPCIGIVCACLPTLQPLLKSALKHILGSSLVAGKFGASSSHEVELQRKARIQRVSSSRDKHCLLRSLDDSQHRNNDERLILRPKEDKAILTTNSEPAEDTQFAGDECSDGQRIENDFMSIRVHREFRRQEEYTGR